MNLKPSEGSSAIQPILKWIARIGSVCSFLIIGLFAFGGNESLAFLSMNEAIGFACFPIGVLFGMLLGWRWPLLGGIFSFVSLTAFYIWHTITSGRAPGGPWFLIFSSPMFFFFASSLFRNQRSIDERLDGKSRD